MTGSSGAGTEPGDRPRYGLSQFAQAWVKALAGTSYVPLTRDEKTQVLYGLAERLAVALRAEPFSDMPGYQIGTDLVAADFAAPEALGNTIAVINERLLRDVGTATAEAGSRMARLLGTLAAGYSWALRDRILDEQEDIRRASLVARARSERALQEAQERFRHAVLHDRLTGLPNRALLTRRLDRVLDDRQPSARLGLCFIGLDGFQSVNDSLGHHVGDRVLVTVADRLGRLATAAGYEAARLGGDEFAILVPDTTCTDDAVKAADRAMAAIAAPISVDGYHLAITAGVGVVERPRAGADPTAVMRAADIALHWAKADGPDHYAIFDTARSTHDQARYRLSAAMPAALDRDEFVLVYQPLVDLAGGTLRGVEALARWHHPELGTLTPDRFIQLAEDTGLIVPMGRRLLEKACRQAAEWQALSATPPYVSVNLAVRQLRHTGLVGDVAAVLDRTGLPADRLELEVTESAIIDTEDGVDSLRALARLGVRLVIDDFGTGYSNLAYLFDLPVHGLKLAGAFVRRLSSPATAQAAEAVLTSLVNLGHTLGLTVTAEGVETADQVRRLAAIGCDIAQGYHYGRPAPPDHVTHLLTTHDPKPD